LKWNGEEVSCDAREESSKALEADSHRGGFSRAISPARTRWGLKKKMSPQLTSLRRPQLGLSGSSFHPILINAKCAV